MGNRGRKRGAVASSLFFGDDLCASHRHATADADLPAHGNQRAYAPANQYSAGYINLDTHIYPCADSHADLCTIGDADLDTFANLSICRNPNPHVDAHRNVDARTTEWK